MEKRGPFEGILLGLHRNDVGIIGVIEVILGFYRDYKVYIGGYIPFIGIIVPLSR